MHSVVVGAHLADEDVVGGEDLDNGFLADENVVGADEHDDYIRGIQLQLCCQVCGGSPGSCLGSGMALVCLFDVGARACSCLTADKLKVGNTRSSERGLEVCAPASLRFKVSMWKLCIREVECHDLLRQ